MPELDRISVHENSTGSTEKVNSSQINSSSNEEDVTLFEHFRKEPLGTIVQPKSPPSKVNPDQALQIRTNAAEVKNRPQSGVKHAKRGFTVSKMKKRKRRTSHYDSLSPSESSSGPCFTKSSKMDEKLSREISRISVKDTERLNQSGIQHLQITKGQTQGLITNDDQRQFTKRARDLSSSSSDSSYPPIKIQQTIKHHKRIKLQSLNSNNDIYQTNDSVTNKALRLSKRVFLSFIGGYTLSGLTKLYNAGNSNNSG